MITTAYIGMGGNLADPYLAIQQAADALRKTPGIYALRMSSCYRTVPIESTGPDFCNAVAEIKTDLDPESLMTHLLKIEAQFGRERSTRNAPRTLDLDLIAYGDQRLHRPSVTVPHPRAHERAFVLIPLCELNPDVLLGPATSTTLEPGFHWKSLLTSAKMADVRPW